MTIESGWCEIQLTDSGVAVVELHGEHDLGTIDQVHSAFESLTAQERDVVLDLSRTAFVDSAVIHAIYRFAARQTDAGRRLVLHVNPESLVRRVLEVAGLLDQLPWAEDHEGAIARMKA